MSEITIENNNKRSLNKIIRTELFSSAIADLWEYIKRIWFFVRITIIQFRCPNWSLDQIPQFPDRKKGMFFPILFFFLNPFGRTAQEKIEKINSGYIAYAKEAISLLVFGILLQLAFLEIAGKETAGNLTIAFHNFVILGEFYILISIFLFISGKMLKKEKNNTIYQTVQESFVYETSMIFGIIVVVVIMEAFGLFQYIDREFLDPFFGTSASEGSTSNIAIFLWFFTGLHPFYFLSSINAKYKITNMFGLILWGGILSFVSFIAFFLAYGEAGAAILNTAQVFN